MGLPVDSLKFLAQARKAGVRFDETLTLGRQHVLASPERIGAILEQNGIWPPPAGVAEFYKELRATTWRFDAFARALGAKNVSACDASAYEGAAIVHDLNQPVPAELKERFDVIIDGGTLEHVFNFPVAIANCMEMVKTGGHLILFTPVNNYMGHGFYQFSPELFYRVLSPENGFQVKRMIALNENVGESSIFGARYPFPISGPWYEVSEPSEIRSRVTLTNDKSVILMVLAAKKERVPLFRTTPQQSDYVPQWQAPSGTGGDNSKKTYSSGVVGWLRGKFSETFCRETLPKLAWLADPFRLSRFGRAHSFKNKRLYRRVKD
jgi:SAM-dependent methyltransferase